jgi:hypothetical protein
MTRRRLALLGGVLAAIIAGSILAVVLLSGGGSKKSSSSTMEMEHSSGSSTGILAMLPSDVPTDSCKKVAGEHPGSNETVDCDVTLKSGKHIYVHADVFKAHKYLLATYKDHGVAEEKAQGGRPDPNLKKATGACTSIEWLGEGPWSHAAGEEAAGRRACYIAPASNEACKKTGAAQCSVVVWTLDISNLFVRAVLPSTQHRNLYTWWRFHAHLFG